MISVEYRIPMYGLGSDFSQFERPITFAEIYTNRFRNITGGAERRPGMSVFSSAIGGDPNLTRLHEYVDQSGNETLFASEDTGNIWKYIPASAAWSISYSVPGGSTVRFISAQAEDKLIFVDGVHRNIYTDDSGAVYHELKAIITNGTMAGGTTTTNVVDGSITNWVNNTLVANDDIIHNITRGGYGIVSTVASASLTITAIGTGGNGAGLTASNQAAGDTYELLDYVELNIINGADNVKRNSAILVAGATTTVVSVSGIDFASTSIRAGDFIYNTTRGAIAIAGAVSANVNLQQAITGQVAGDTVAFFKSAMPIASWVHVHYGRVYYLDSRDQKSIVISAPDDPQDVTTFQKTLDATSFSFGTQQPTGDIILSMASFQKYFVASGEKNLYIYEGVNPIQDSSTSSIDFKPIAFYPNGIASRFGLGTNGSDLLHVTTEGLQAINIGNISNTTVQNNASVPIRTEILNAILATNTNDIQLSFYPRRSWLINKIGDICYVLNTNPTYNDAGQLQIISSWHKFTGPWAQQNHYFIRRNGDLLACGQNGFVYQLDSSAATDVGAPIATDIQTAWLRLEEPQRTVRVKQGQYIKPVFESGHNLQYTINAVAGFEQYSSDSIIVSAGGTGQIGQAIIGTDPIGLGTFSQADKYPLRWRGEQVRIEFTTNSSATPDIITGFTLYGVIGGIR